MSQYEWQMLQVEYKFIIFYMNEFFMWINARA